VPADRPETTPEDKPILATTGLSLVQLPPVVVLVHNAVELTHIGVIPAIVCGIGAVTVTVCVAVLTHPPMVVTEYIITDVPAVTPVTIPVEGPTVATTGVPLVQVPPVVVLVHVATEPIHIGVVPAIVCGIGAITVTVCEAVLTHPPTVTEYVITEVPADTPVTTPVMPSAVAIAGVPLVHVPPVVVLVHVAIDPTHIGVVPDIV